MRKRSWLVAVGLCVQSGLVGAQDSAPPGTATEPPQHDPKAPAPVEPAGETAIYPRQAPATGDADAVGYPTATGQRYEQEAHYGTDTYVGTEALPIVPEAKPYALSMHQKYPLKADLQLEVPIPLTDNHDSSTVGVGVSGMFGWDLGFLLPTLGIGWSWAHLNLPPGYRDDDRNLKRFHLNLGLIAEFENKSIVTPVIGALVDFNWWHVSGDDSIACGGYYYWGCYQVENYRYTTGFSFKAGLDFRFFKNDRFSLGTGVLPQVTLSGGPFRHTEWWLSPYAVFTVRN